MFRAIIKFFDKLEDKVRIRLSHYPILYAIIGGIGTVLFWRGVWHTADYISLIYLPGNVNEAGTALGAMSLPAPIDGLVSFGIGLFLLLITGLYVATFIGDHILMSGLKGDKKLTERTEVEVKEDVELDRKMREELHSLSKKLDNIEDLLKEK